MRPKGKHRATPPPPAPVCPKPAVRPLYHPAMILTIQARGALNQDTFENAGRWKEADVDRLVIDLRKCWFVDSYALVTLLTVMTLWAMGGDEVRLHLPASKGARTYLARMHFFELLPEGIDCDEPLPTVTERPSMLVPLKRLDLDAGEHAIDELGRFVWPQLPARLADAFTEALVEIGANVIQHAGARVGFVAAQRFENAYQGRVPPRLQLVVGDAGIGIRASLAAGRPEAAGMSDEQAILLALREGVTGKPGTNSGVGLSTVREYADAFMGILRVRSGEGMVVRRRRVQSSRLVPGLPGTIVAVELASPGRRM